MGPAIGLEAEACSEFAGEGAWNHRAVGRDEIGGLKVACGIRGTNGIQIALKKGSEICPVRKIETLEEEFDIVLFCKGNRLADSGVKLDECLSAN